MASSQAINNVFVYGSLLADEVVRALLNRVPATCPAILNDYQRFSIKGRVYPAIIPVEGQKVAGRVLMGITGPELHVLDVFEDVEYIRDVVDVSRKDNNDKMTVLAYVWEDKNDPSLYGNWDFEEWKQLHMSDFLGMTMDFVKELEQEESKSRVETYESYYHQDNDQSSASML